MRTSNLIKYQSKNPIQIMLMNHFQKKMVGLVENKQDVVSVADVGCGEGFGLKNLKNNKVGKKYLGLDSSKKALELAKKINPEFKYVKGDIYKLPFKSKSFDLVVCSEVLEHLNDPEAALEELRRVSKKYILISVPFEPWFRVLNFFRGKYLRTWGNHPEHINWWGRRSFANFVQRQVKILDHIVSLPWQIVLIRV